MPFGPWPGVRSGGGAGGFDIALSYGHGVPGTDDQLPDSESGYSIWLSPTLDADHSQFNQVREWVTPVDLTSLSFTAFVDASQINGIGIAPVAKLVITVDGADTAFEAVIPQGTTTLLTLAAGGALAVPAGSRVGVAFETNDAMDVGSTLRVEVLLEGNTSSAVVLTGPPLEGLAFWANSTATNNTVSAGKLIVAKDQVGTQDLDTFPLGKAPDVVPAAFNGLTAWQFSSAGGIPAQQIGRTSNLKQTNGLEFVQGVPRTIAALYAPQLDVFTNTGGAMATFRQGDGATQMFIAEAYGVAAGGNTRVFDSNDGFVRTFASVVAAGSPYYVDWEYDGTNIRFSINGVEKTLSSAVANPCDNSPHPGFFLGNSWEFTATLLFPFNGFLVDVLVYDVNLNTDPARLNRLRNYLKTKGGI